MAAQPPETSIMPVETVKKPVRCRADRVKPELRQQFGITAEQIKNKTGIVVSTLEIPEYKSFDEMLANESAKLNNDEAAAKALIFKWADTQMATTLANNERKKFEAPPVSKSVSPADAILWAKKNDLEGLNAAIKSEEANALENFIEATKAKILKEREAAIAAGTAVEADDENDA